MAGILLSTPGTQPGTVGPTVGALPSEVAAGLAVTLGLFLLLVALDVLRAYLLPGALSEGRMQRVEHLREGLRTLVPVTLALLVVFLMYVFERFERVV